MSRETRSGLDRKLMPFPLSKRITLTGSTQYKIVIPSATEGHSLMYVHSDPASKGYGGTTDYLKRGVTDYTSRDLVFMLGDFTKNEWYTTYLLSNEDVQTTWLIGDNGKYFAHQFECLTDNETMSAVRVGIFDKTGSPNDLEIALQADSAGDPSGSDIELKTILASAISYANCAATGSIRSTTGWTSSLTGGNKYWIVIREKTPYAGAGNYYKPCICRFQYKYLKTYSATGYENQRELKLRVETDSNTYGQLQADSLIYNGLPDITTTDWVAQSFIVEDTTDITGILFHMACATDRPAMTVSIYDDSGGDPNSQLVEATPHYSDLWSDGIGVTNIAHASFEPIQLTANTKYWVVWKGLSGCPETYLHYVDTFSGYEDCGYRDTTYFVKSTTTSGSSWSSHTRKDISFTLATETLPEEYDNLSSELVVTVPASAQLSNLFRVHKPWKNLSSMFLLGVTAGTADLSGEFSVTNEGEDNLSKEFAIQRASDIELSSELEIQKGAEENLSTEFVVLQEATTTLSSEFTSQQSASVTLPNLFRVHTPWRELPSEFAIGIVGEQIAFSAEFSVTNIEQTQLSKEFAIQRSTSITYSSEFTIQRASSIQQSAEFEIQKSDSTEFSTEFQIRKSGEKNLSKELLVQASGTATLSSRLQVGEYETGEANLSSTLVAGVMIISEFAENLDELEVYEVASTELPSEFKVQQPASTTLSSEFAIQKPASTTLSSEFSVTNISATDLPSQFTIQKSTSIEVSCEFVIQRSAYIELSAEFIVINVGLDQLPSQFTVQQPSSITYSSEFAVQQPDSTYLSSEFLIQKPSSADSSASSLASSTTSKLPARSISVLLPYISSPMPQSLFIALFFANYRTAG